MTSTEDDDLQELLGRAAKAHDETHRLLAELASKQTELAAIQERLAEVAMRREAAVTMRHGGTYRVSDDVFLHSDQR